MCIVAVHCKGDGSEVSEWMSERASEQAKEFERERKKIIGTQIQRNIYASELRAQEKEEKQK